MSKLIVNTGTLSAGGAERVLSILSTPFADSFDEVHYVMWLDTKYPEIFYEIDPRVKIVRVSEESGSAKVFNHVRWFRKYVRQENPDLVLSFMKKIGLASSISLLFSGVKQVISERNDPRANKSKNLRRLINLTYLLPDVKGIVMQTQANKDYFESDTIRNKTVVIYNPILMSESYVGKSVSEKKRENIVSVGRLTKQKRFDVLIRAFSKFHKVHSSYKLYIFGEGEKRKELEKLVDDLSLKNCVFLAGRSNNVLDLISNAKMFCMSSAFEGMSNALIEAMCVGLPCISTRVSGATDLIKDGDNGFLVDIGDEEAIADKMIELSNDSELCSRMGEAASKTYQKLCAEVISKQWIDYLYKIVREL